jgi:hypothetical protein
MYQRYDISQTELLLYYYYMHRLKEMYVALIRAQHKTAEYRESAFQSGRDLALAFTEIKLKNE